MVIQMTNPIMNVGRQEPAINPVVARLDGGKLIAAKRIGPRLSTKVFILTISVGLPHFNLGFRQGGNTI